MATDATDPGIKEPDDFDREKVGEVMGRAYAEWAEEDHRTKRGLAFRMAWRERCKCDQNWCPRRLARWFYTMKLYVCMLTGRFVYAFPYPYDESIEVATIRSHQDGWGWNADWVEVGRGVFTGWRYSFKSDGDSCY